MLIGNVEPAREFEARFVLNHEVLLNIVVALFLYTWAYVPRLSEDP